jgi:dTDP-4-amino-4,6-dideoxygalactose transaminase
MKVPLLDLKAQYATIKDEVLAAVAEVLDSQVCVGGPKVIELEQKIAAISDCKYAVGVSSGTDALPKPAVINAKRKRAEQIRTRVTKILRVLRLPD